MINKRRQVCSRTDWRLLFEPVFYEQGKFDINQYFLQWTHSISFLLLEKQYYYHNIIFYRATFLQFPAGTAVCIDAL